MKPPLCSRADLLLALSSERDEATGFIARQLGFELEAKSEYREASEEGASGVAMPSQSSIVPSAGEALQTFPELPFWRLEGCEYYADDSAPEQPVAEVASSWQATAEPRHPPLVSWSRLMPRLRQGLLYATPTRAIDIPKTVARLSCAEIMATLPRKGRRGWGSELQVIVDRSTAMAPYGSDQRSLCAELTRLFPKQAISYADYRQGCAEPTMSGKRGNDRRYRLPPPGTLVIALTDLGLLSSPAEQANWKRLGQRLQQQGHCRPLALIPSDVPPPDSALQRDWRLIPWGEPRVVLDQSSARQLEQLLVLLSPATRIEPGFLRQVRQLIGADSAVEAAFWQHPSLISRSSVAATLDPEQANRLRARFDGQEAALRREVLKRLRRWRTHQPREIWYEELISLTAASQALLPRPEELTEARAFFVALGLRLVEGETVAGLYSWFCDIEERLPETVWHQAALKPALQRLWATVHHGEPDAEPPPDYDPRTTHMATERSPRTFQLYQHHTALEIVAAPPPTGRAGEVNPGSWLGQLKSRSGEFALLPLEPDYFWQSGKPPAWASDWGEDRFGRWAAFGLEFNGRPVSQRMRWIASGSFLMGSLEDEAERYDDEGPQHKVSLSRGYWLFDTAVCQALWQAVMGENPSNFEGAELPVESVSWRDCQQFIEKLNSLKPGLELALPSEAQWEYACRAGSQTRYSFGDQITPGQANYYDSSGSGTVAVKGFQPNSWGLYQMHGNVDEWCLDGQREYQDQEEIDPLGSQESGAWRVVRGGSWGNDARSVRAACRGASVPDFRYFYLGFRCARVQAGAEPIEPLPSRSGTRRAAPDRSGAAARVVVAESQRSAQLPWPVECDFVIRSDAGELTFRQLCCPEWAAVTGRDRFGLWAGIELEGEKGKVRQRLRWIPPGRFLMGSPESEHGGLAKGGNDPEWFTREGPQHLVTISQGYWLFDTPVTQALWQVVMESNPSRFQSPQRPVEQVSWEEANGFIEKLNQKIPGVNLTLPTEAQWEYACRANSSTSTYNGELEIVGRRNGPVLDDITWYGGNSGVDFDLEEGDDSSSWPEKQYEHSKTGTREVAMKRPNGWGLYDTLGNVWEWCLDGVRKYQDQESVDPVGPQEDGAGRVVRGGSWGSRARSVRAAYRGAFDPGFRGSLLGFRCAQVQEPAGAEPIEPLPSRSGTRRAATDRSGVAGG